MVVHDSRGAADGAGDGRDDGFIERARENSVWGRMGDAGGESAGGELLHFFGDLGSMSIQRPAKDAREGEDIIDLIGEIAPAGSDDGGAGLASEVRIDFRNRIGHGKDDGVRSHGFDHVGVDEIAAA